MELSTHVGLGVPTGNFTGYFGKHRDGEMDQGCGFIPLGNRERDKPIYNGLEERDSDPNIRRI